MSNPKGQHFIPRLHLQHFAGVQPKGHVWTYTKADGKKFSRMPEETAKQTHFYSVEAPDGSYDLRIEEMLARIESTAAPIYMRLINGKIPEHQDKMDMAQFLAVMVVRTPGSRKDAAEMVGRMIQIRNYATGVHDRAFNSLVHRIEQGEGRQLTEESRTSLRRSLIDPSGYRLELGKEWALQHLTAADKLTPVLFQMRWRTIGAAQGFFITSDDPVVRWVEPKTWHPIYGDHGYLNKTAVVTFPLTPKVMLAMSWEDEGANAFAGRQGVDRLNRLRALQADEYLYAHLDHEVIRRMAVATKGSRPRMTTEGFGPKKFAATTLRRGRANRPS
ncbi:MULTISPECIES: DUF4238 domain-containing protein [unclassified Mesorhizobium]|uniref:DUF4238 domain-containing protein n=3 Tax=Mesorhizobium TaxID=68287 RepID=UPI000FE9406F|nr:MULTISPECIES: DUF4238 domain-containing protein [unclassified Mesorhizobium]RWD68986.1 MAG: DUF4238 domain-containing protein [Mesorhizobium sp.]